MHREVSPPNPYTKTPGMGCTGCGVARSILLRKNRGDSRHVDLYRTLCEGPPLPLTFGRDVVGVGKGGHGVGLGTRTY